MQLLKSSICAPAPRRFSDQGSTRRRNRMLLTMAIGIMSVTAALRPIDAHASNDWTETRTVTYRAGDVGPLRDPVGQVLTFPTCSFGQGVGSLCFGPTVGDTFTVHIDDDSGREVGGVVIIETRQGTVSHPVCAKSKPLPVVPGGLSVHLDAPGDVRGTHWFGGPGCTEIRPLGGTTGATTLGATSGRVLVTFSGGDR